MIKQQTQIDKYRQKIDQERFRQRHRYKTISGTPKNVKASYKLMFCYATWPTWDAIWGPAGSERGSRKHEYSNTPSCGGQRIPYRNVAYMLLTQLYTRAVQHITGRVIHPDYSRFRKSPEHSQTAFLELPCSKHLLESIGDVNFSCIYLYIYIYIYIYTYIYICIYYIYIHT